MSLQLELLDNNSFSQELENDFQQDEDISFEGRRRRLTRVSKRRPVGRVVYSMFVSYLVLMDMVSYVGVYGM